MRGAAWLALAGLVAAGLPARPPRAEAEPPATTVVIETPVEGALVPREFVVSGRVVGPDATKGVLRVAGTDMKVAEDGTFSARLTVGTDGPRAIRVLHAVVGLPATPLERAVVVDGTPPTLEMLDPLTEEQVYATDEARVRGRARDPHLHQVTMNGRPVAVGASGTFEATFLLPGEDVVEVIVVAEDGAGNRTSALRRIRRGTVVAAKPPAPRASKTLEVRIDPTGGVSVHDDAGARPVGALGRDPAVSAATLGGLEAALGAVTAASARDGDGTSRLVLDLETAAATPWEWTRWITQVAAGPAVRLRRMRWGTTEDDRPPVQATLEETQAPRTGPVLRVALNAPPNADLLATQTTVSMAGSAWTLGPLDPRPPAERKGPPNRTGARTAPLDAFASEAAKALRNDPSLKANVRVEPVAAASIPTDDVVQTLRALESVGLSFASISGGPLPFPPGFAPAPAGAKTPAAGKPPAPPSVPATPTTSFATAFPTRAAHRTRIAAGAYSWADRPIENALRWLAAHQSEDGRWEAAGWHRWCDGQKEASASPRPPDGAGKSIYDVGVTGLALLAFLGAGYTAEGDHPYARNVDSGLRFLVGAQDADGYIGVRSRGHSIYEHAISALALVDAYGMSGAPTYRAPAQRALDIAHEARNPYFAWRYGIKPGDNDTSVTGWMATLLHDAVLVNRAEERHERPASFVMDKHALPDALDWIRKMTDPSTGRVGYQQRGTGPARPTELIDAFPAEKSESATAIGLFLRSFLVVNPQGAEGNAILLGNQLCQNLLPRWNRGDGSIDMYYWYYGTLAMVQRGESEWTNWSRALRIAVVNTQKPEGGPCALQGSWDPVDPWGPDGGRVYATAMCALALEAAERYERPVR